MIKYITGNTLANTVRMAARSRRPKAVFLASEEKDIELVQALLAEKECRVIPAHTRENAIHAFELLIKSGYQGVFTAVNTRFAPSEDQEILGHGEQPKDIIGIEGTWEEVRAQDELLAGQRVRLTLVGDSGGRGEKAPAPNQDMLDALKEIEELWKSMNPKKDKEDYLDEARSGAMYGYGDDD
jgi:hypothetical protein